MFSFLCKQIPNLILLFCGLCKHICSLCLEPFFFRFASQSFFSARQMEIDRSTGTWNHLGKGIGLVSLDVASLSITHQLLVLSPEYIHMVARLFELLYIYIYIIDISCKRNDVVYIYIYVYMYIYMYISIYMCLYIYIYLCMCICVLPPSHLVEECFRHLSHVSSHHHLPPLALTHMNHMNVNLACCHEFVSSTRQLETHHCRIAILPSLL